MSDGLSTVRLPILGAAVPSSSEIGGMLAQVSFLASVEPRLLRELAARSFVRRVEPHRPVMQQGEYGHSLFVLLRGVVRLECVTETGELAVLDRMTDPGDVAGEPAVLGNARRATSAIAELPSVLLEIEKSRLEALDRAAPGAGVLERLKRESEIRIIRTFAAQHSLFGRLDQRMRERMFARARLERHPRDASVFEEGAAAATVVLVKSGLLRLERAAGAQISVLGYFNSGDVTGVFESTRPGRLVAAYFCEVIQVPREDFMTLERHRPEFLEHFKKTEISRRGRLRNVVVGSERDGSETILAFLDDFVKDGAQEAQSLLTIDLDLCIRCGNCTRACEARHGRARMTRRGKELVRRVDPNDPERHQTLLFTSSCRHCVNPECMVGCPTGAIHRKITGEVDVHDFCIGCSNCAIRCPWGNITMAPTPGRMVAFDGVMEERPLIASKCNLCVGYDEANCVHNCPTGAIIRLEPNEFFPEVRGLLGGKDKEALSGKTARTRPAQLAWRRGVPTAGGLILAALIATFTLAPRPYWPGSPHGLALGGAALLAMLAAMLLPLRRRIAHVRAQLGPFKIWARAHTWIGAIAFVAVMLHADLHPGAFLTSSLFLLVTLVFVLGVFGVAFQRWLPSAITRLEGPSQLEEDLHEERRKLSTQVEQLQAEHSALAKLAPAIEVAAGSLRSRLSSGYQERLARDRAVGALAGRDVPDEARLSLEQLVLARVRDREIAASLLLYQLRRGWLVLHIAASVPLVILALLHAASVLYYRAF